MFWIAYLLLRPKSFRLLKLVEYGVSNSVLKLDVHECFLLITLCSVCFNEYGLGIMIMLGLIVRLAYISLISGHFAFSCLNVENEYCCFKTLWMCPETYMNRVWDYLFV